MFVIEQTGGFAYANVAKDTGVFGGMGILRLESVAYWQNLPRAQGADAVLGRTMLELLSQAGPDQLRALNYRVGMGLAAEHPLTDVATLSQLKTGAQKFLSDRGWGWLQIEENDHSIDFFHGCSPLRAWFGLAGLAWSTALFEGLYWGWLRQAGAADGLELRQTGNPKGDEDLFCFRLAHQRFFAG